MIRTLFHAGRSTVALSLFAALLITGCGTSGQSTAVIDAPSSETEQRAEADTSDKSNQDSRQPADSADAAASEIDESDAYAEQTYANAPRESSERVLTAEEAGEESGPLLDHEGYPEPYIDEIDPSDAYASDDAYYAEPEGYEAEIEGRIDDEGNVLPLVVNGLEIGMEYDIARALILADGWAPHSLHLERNPDNPGVRAYHEQGYVEAVECAGNSLCSVSFVEREGYKFGVTTFGEPPVIRSWGPIYQ